uniref:DUF1985 domain-containing protein n=1 Tax=Lactuca sativa TaxID=4236 RepID=A0A9R1UQ19_LACSA|nr:hypothetical protein LSAT_V11C800437160 [Lactuca sativa]
MLSVQPFQHSNKQLLASVTVKGSCNNITEALDRLEGQRRELFHTTAFGYWLGVQVMTGDPLLCHGLFLHQLRPTHEMDAEERLHFQISRYRMSFGAEEFCLITGFHFGRFPRTKKEFTQKETSFRSRVFPERTDASLSVGDVRDFILSNRFETVSDEDGVRACLLYVLNQGFLGKEKTDKITKEWLWLIENLDDWNSFLWHHSYGELRKIFGKIDVYVKANEHKQLKYTVSGFSAPFKIWIWEMFPYIRGKFSIRHNNKNIPRITRWGHIRRLTWVEVCDIYNVDKDEMHRPKSGMHVSDNEAATEYYLSYKKGDLSPIASPLRNNFRRHEVSSSGPSSSSTHSIHSQPPRGTLDPSTAEDFEIRIRRVEEELRKRSIYPGINMDSCFDNPVGTRGQKTQKRNKVCCGASSSTIDYEARLAEALGDLVSHHGLSFNDCSRVVPSLSQNVIRVGVFLHLQLPEKRLGLIREILASLPAP